MEEDPLGDDVVHAEARDIYLLMPTVYYISRNERAQWFVDRLNGVVNIPCGDKQSSPVKNGNSEDVPQEECEHQEIEVLSVVPSVTSPIHESKSAQFRITPETQVVFLAPRYKLAFILDMSPTVANIDIASAGVLYDKIITALTSTMKETIATLLIPGSTTPFSPVIFITIIAHTSLVNCRKNQVLIQGCVLTRDNVDSILEGVQHQLRRFESCVASSLAEVVDTKTLEEEDDDEQHLTGGLFEDIVEPPVTPDPAMYLTTPEASFVNMMRYGILALQMLPENSNGGIIVLTDGIVGMPDANMFESLMARLRHANISCSFVQLSASKSLGGLGQVPYPDLMKFIATATFGAYFSQPPKCDPDCGMNKCHHAFLTWSFRKGLSSYTFGDQVNNVEMSQDLIWTDRVPAFAGSDKLQWTPKLMRKKLTERTLHLPMPVVLSCRMREGYSIQEIVIKGESQIEVRLAQLWRDNVRILYALSSVWPLDAKRLCRVEVGVEATYDFLHDVTCPMKKPFNSPYRTAVVKKYWHMLQDMSDTDQRLLQLHSFNTNVIHFTVPESIKQGVPLLIQAANSSTPELNSQFSSKDPAVMQFVSFWKHVLDISNWQKWLHTHRIGLILEHDIALAKHLHVPNSSGRFNVITCRQAQSALNFFLRDWCTFVLVENHLYVKLQYKDAEKPPTSFYVVHTAAKPPCIVLRLGFIGGTPCKDRNEELIILKEHLSQLNFPGQRGTQVEDKGSKTVLPVNQRKPSLEAIAGPPHPAQIGHKPPLQRLWSEIPCCKITRKPIEKMLIKYERMPLTFNFLDCPPAVDQSGHLTQALSADRLAYDNFTILSRYLFHHRWIWRVQSGSSSSSPPLLALGRILSNLAQIRLQEGFNFAHTHCGIVNLVAELRMEEDESSPDEEFKGQRPDVVPSILQYVIFPPHTTTAARDSVSEEDPEFMDAEHAEGELQIITECWVEPQSGVVSDNPPERSFLDGLHFSNIPQAIFPRDLECISTMVTFEHLNLMSQNCHVPSPTLLSRSPVSESLPTEGAAHLHSTQPGTSIQHVCFPFDLLRLLPKCQQVELLFSTLIQDTSSPGSRSRVGAADAQTDSVEDMTSPNRLLMNLFLDQLRAMHHREVHLTGSECEQFMHLIQSRDRDEELHPLPFVPPQEELMEEADLLDEQSRKGGMTRSESTLSISTSVSIGSAFTSNSNFTSQSQMTAQNQVPSKLSVTTGRLSRVTSPLFGLRDAEDAKHLDGKAAQTYDFLKNNEAFLEDDSAGVARWCCFLKSVSSSQVLLCFVPASYDDLEMLSRTQKPETPVKTDAKADETLKGPEAPGPERKFSLESGTITGDSSTTLDAFLASSPSNAQEASPSQTSPAAPPPPPPPQKETPELKTMQLPVYVYNCPLNYLSEQLVNRWTFQKLNDLYEDMQFPVIEAEDFNASPEREKKLSDSERWRGAGEGSAVNIYGDEEDLRQHCTLLSETYLRCFVNGVYRSLLSGHHIDGRDVDTAINNICEEHLPCEVDISQFLQLSCGHIRQIVERVRMDQMEQEDMMKTMPKLLISPKVEKEDGGSQSETGTDDPLTSPVVRIPLPLIMNAQNCEAEVGLHQLIREKFVLALHQFFHPVPSHPDFYFYSPKTEPAEKEVSHIRNAEQCNLSKILEAMHEEPESDQAQHRESDLDGEDTDHRGGTVINLDEESVVSNKGSITLSSYAEEDLDEPHVLDEMENSEPLFLHLTCSVRTTGNVLRSTTIASLPTCLAELKDCLGDLSAEVNLNECYITLDMICLTLPPEDNLMEATARPCYERMTSIVSQISFSSHADDTDLDAASTTDVGGLSRQASEVPSSIPKPQLGALNACKEQIKWLMTDEMVSALRLTTPVTEETLEMVAEHVKNSLPRDNWASVLDHVYLKFVYGPEQSLTHFIEEFERMNLPGYHLNKEGRFYYLYIDRAHATSMVTMAHQREISNALMCLENDTYLTQEAVLLPSEIISPAHVRAEAEPPPQLTQDASVVVLSTLVDDGDAAVGDGFRAEDIKISVIRPSPVKEVPKDRIELDFEAQEQQEDRVHMNFRDDHISDRSSGSSIQVIEEKEGDEGLSFTARPDLQRQEALPEIYESDPVPSLMDEVFRENIDAECSTTKDTEPSKGRSFEGDLPREEEQPKQQLQQLNRPADKGAIVIKKAQSSGSFEKYKSERPKLFQTASTVEVSSSNASGTMTPNRRSSLGLYTPKPSIASGLNTPLSTIGTQSRCSGCFDDGYEGDSSDSDEDGVMMSFSESAVQRPVLPNFWLAMCITEGLVDVYFHTRDYHLTHSDTDNHCNSENIHQRELYNMVITNITQTCRIVNQRLLLEELYATRMCNSLLVPEAEEDLQWTGDMSNKHRHKLHDSDDSDNEAPQNRYLAATMQFIPGHFACDCIWTEHFLIHPRLKVTAPRTGTTHGIQTLRSVLNKFSVNNRKNMFVVKENNGAVFYLSLSEYNGDSFNPPSAAEFKPEDDPAWLTFSRSSSVISMSLRRGTDLEEESSAFQVVNPSKKTSNASAYDIPDTDSMTSSRLLMSQSSTNSIRAAKSEDYVTLSAHGVVPVGPEISDDLVQLLQRKLDDAVLEILTLTLSRNPMCKLTAEDIVFIQRPNTAPSRIFKLTIPPSALLQQSALGYYLRQNLLHFVFTPKYMDSSHVFCHYDGHGAAKPVPEEDIFLYNRSQQAGGKVGGSSIACVLLSFVDGCGNPVVLLSSPKPSPSAYKEPLDAAMFDSLVHVDPFVEKGRGPGPMALVQFCIWERGQVDLDQLCELLKQAMRHAVCDVITEFRMLTVPLCKVPPHSARGIESPLPSAPSSPSFCLKQDSETKGSGLHSEAAIKKQHSEGGRTPKEKSSFGAFMSDIFKTNKTASLGTPKEELNADDLSANTLSAPPSAMQEMESQWKNKIEVQQNIERYENGEKGHMHSFLQTTLREWLDFCHATGCPTVAKSSYTLHSRFPVDYVLKDLHSNVASICSDVSLRIFKRMQTLHSDSDPIFFPYSVPIKHNNKDRPDSADLSSFAGSVHIPGKTNEYVVVCRNIGQWRGSMESPSLLKDFTEHLPSAPKSAGPQKVKNFKTYYRFHPLESSNETKRPEAGGVASGDCMDNAFVPRQRLLLLFIEDKQLTAYYYNWSGETHSSLEKQLNATINWHNARWHLMSWIICQKSGLFDHCTFGDMPGEDSPQPVQSMSEIDSLVKCTSPPTAAQVSRVRHRSGNLIQRMLGPGAHVPHHLNAGNPFQSPGLMLCRMYQDIKPPSAMHRSSYAKMKDPLHRHGAQFMEMRALERRENEKRNALENLYMTWQQRVSNPPITDDDLELLKNSSRLIHSVASPLLFTPAWRRKALGKMDAPKRRDPPEPPKSRSRHGSGASVKSKRSDSFDMRTKKLSGGGHTPDSPDVSAHEERWHSDLKTEFVGQYMQYLQGLGFAQVQVRAAETKKSYARSPRASTEKRAHYYNFHPKSCNTYLQKTFPGGIMLIEIGFQEVYFSIHVYALECSRLPVGKNVNTSLAHIFTDECDKFKDLTHVHSFTHDFHLRVVQTFLSSPLHPIVMKQGYHITAFLSDFVKHYSFAPGFARNCIIEGSVTVHNTNSSGQQLFDYMLQHADKLYRMKSVRMSPCPYEEEWDADNDCALVLQFEPRKLHKKTDGSDASESETLDHDIGLIICHDSQSKASSANSLRLRFWLILTNRFDRFPKDQLEKRLGMFKSSHTFPATSQFLLSTSDPGDDLEDVHRGKRFQLTVVKFDGQEITKLLVTLESGEGNFDQIPAVHQHINIRPELAQARQESTNYLGYSNAHQTPIFNLLKEEAKRVRMMIHSMVQETMSRCRRDLLWQRMLLSNVADEEEKRRKHRGSDEDSRDSLMSKLTFPEFEELLKIVVSVSLDQIDYRLGILLNMNAPWYQGLIRVLTQRYRDEHRLFSSPDGITQHLVVLNPNHLDMLLLLTINSTTGLQNLCAVHRETENEEVDDMPSLTALATQNHVESFVNACCFHMWASML